MNHLKPILNTLNILFMAILFVMVMVGGVFAFLLSSDDVATKPELKNLFNVVVPVVFLAAIVISNMISKKQLTAIDKNASLEDKLKKYQSIMIVRLALVEAAALLSSVAAYLTGYMYFFTGTAAAVILLYTVRPSAGNILNDLQLSQTEKLELEKP